MSPSRCLCWVTSLRAHTGKEDQGGGLIWRRRDANNYYIARYNPLERNFRVYYVNREALNSTRH